MTDGSLTYRLTWWEAIELLDHLSRRPDLWFRSDDNENLWVHSAPNSGDVPGFGLLFTPPTDTTSLYRIFIIQALPILWVPSEVQTYVSRLIRSWTTFSNREEISSFLQSELHVPPEHADFAAIAIEALEWKSDDEGEPSLPAEQVELWERPSTRISTEEPNHIGTFLLSGQAGWLKLRLAFGMLRVEASIRPRDRDHPVLLEGFVRPSRGTASAAAAEIAGWDTTEDETQSSTTAVKQRSLL